MRRGHAALLIGSLVAVMIVGLPGAVAARDRSAVVRPASGLWGRLQHRVSVTPYLRVLTRRGRHHRRVEIRGRQIRRIRFLEQRLERLHGQADYALARGLSVESSSPLGRTILETTRQVRSLQGKVRLPIARAARKMSEPDRVPAPPKASKRSSGSAARMYHWWANFWGARQ